MDLLSPKVCLSFLSVKEMAMILCVLNIFLFHNVAAGLTNGTILAVFTFGDSYLATGNNDYIITIAKSNFPPYGRDFMGGKPTGRFSNGRLPSDLIAEAFGVKKFLPAYLDPNLQLQDLLTGVCFASAGTGFDPLTAKIQEYKGKITAAIGSARTATLLSESFFHVSLGINDYIVTYFNTPLRSAQYDIPAYTDFLLELASNFYQELYALGARKIGVTNLPPLGCLPFLRTLRGGIERACYEPANQAAVLYNSKLPALLVSLNKRLPEASLIYIDIYNTFLSVIQDPAQYGIEVVEKGCCGTGIVESGPVCNKDSTGTCNDASKYLFWDIVHPTETANKILTSAILTQVNKSF